MTGIIYMYLVALCVAVQSKASQAPRRYKALAPYGRLLPLTTMMCGVYARNFNATMALPCRVQDWKLPSLHIYCVIGYIDWIAVSSF